MNDELPDIDPNLPATDPAAMEELNQRLIIPRFRARGGRLGGQFEGMPALLLNTVGARSGAPRTTPLAYVRDGDRYVVIASRAGAPTNPAWYHNLVAHPRATVEVGTDRFEVRATVADGEERDRLFQKMAAQLPMFAAYQRKTTRRIPVVVLERLEDGRGVPTVGDRIEREILIEAPVEVVWSALTEPDQISRWFADAARVEVRPGGQGTLTWRDRATAQPTVARIAVEAVEPPRRFAFRWGQPEGAEPGEGNSRLVEFTLLPEGGAAGEGLRPAAAGGRMPPSPEGGRTRVRLVERGWQALALPDERKAKEFDVFSKGWDVHLASLRDFATRRSQTSPSGGGTPMTPPNRDRLADAYASAATGDLSRLMDLLGDDITWRATGRSPVSGVYRGKEQISTFFARTFEVYGGTLRLDVRAILADAGHGVVLTGERATYQGEELSYSAAHLYTLDERGKVSEFLALVDDAYHDFWARHAPAQGTRTGRTERG